MLSLMRSLEEPVGSSPGGHGEFAQACYSCYGSLAHCLA